MATLHGYCTLHKIGYRRDLDPTCPQCTIARITPFVQMDFDPTLQKPLDAAGKPVEIAAVVPTPI